jgi:hypothetical protein
MHQIFGTIDGVGDEILHSLLKHRSCDVVLVGAALVASFVALFLLVIQTITAVAA